jgi:hypothetical protein
VEFPSRSTARSWGRFLSQGTQSVLRSAGGMREGRACGALEDITPFSPSMAAREARLRPFGPA